MIESFLRRTVLDRKTVLQQTVLALVALGCGSGVPEGGIEAVDIGQVEQPIVGGETDREHSAVLAIALVTRREEALCTGSLIAPNLVLTARHCVAITESEKVDCGDSTFGRLYAPENLWVSSSISIGTGANFHPVREILVPEEGELCGSDIALMILDGQYRETSVTPIAPRLDQPARRGESFTAVGFGDALAEGDPGVRRALDGLAVVCGPSDCNAPNLLTQREFVGEQGVCDGDSGGPALDASGRVVGVASRATEDCGLAVYSAVSPWRDWIVGVAEQAFAQGRYDSPEWLSDELDEIASASTPGGAAPVGDLAGNNSSGNSSSGNASSGNGVTPDSDFQASSHRDAGCSIAVLGSGRAAPTGSRTAQHTAGLSALALAGALALRRPRRSARR
jgi:hypothetical protein